MDVRKQNSAKESICTCMRWSNKSMEKIT